MSKDKRMFYRKNGAIYYYFSPLHKMVNHKLAQSTRKCDCRRFCCCCCRRLNSIGISLHICKNIRKKVKNTYESEWWRIENSHFIIIGNIKKGEEKNREIGLKDSITYSNYGVPVASQQLKSMKISFQTATAPHIVIIIISFVFAFKYGPNFGNEVSKRENVENVFTKDQRKQTKRQTNRTKMDSNPSRDFVMRWKS